MTDQQRFSEVLDEHHEWPGPYTFKFIVPAAKVEDVEALFVAGAPRRRASKNGKYISVTVRLQMSSSAEVIAIYQRAYAIQGLMAL